MEINNSNKDLSWKREGDEKKDSEDEWEEEDDDEEEKEAERRGREEMDRSEEGEKGEKRGSYLLLSLNACISRTASRNSPPVSDIIVSLMN